jgi:hypothetical protein
LLPQAQRMGKRVAIVQSNYIPWKGYFDLIQSVDEFILYDDMQYTRRDWRNRNQIKTSNGLAWLTIPVQVKGNYFQAIKDIQISDPTWNTLHWKAIMHNYARAKCFQLFKARIEALYLNCRENYLSQINYYFLKAICQILGIQTPIRWSMDYDLGSGKTEKLVNLCQQLGATEYLSGPSAKNYIEPQLFVEAGIDLLYIDYSEYPEYNQLFPPFQHGVTILDLIFNEGENATRYMKAFNG